MLRRRWLLPLPSPSLSSSARRGLKRRGPTELVAVRTGRHRSAELGASLRRLSFSPPIQSLARRHSPPRRQGADAWEALRRSFVFRGQPLGTIAAFDHASEEVLNYDQVFVRDFVPSVLAFSQM